MKRSIYHIILIMLCLAAWSCTNPKKRSAAAPASHSNAAAAAIVTGGGAMTSSQPIGVAATTDDYESRISIEAYDQGYEDGYEDASSGRGIYYSFVDDNEYSGDKADIYRDAYAEGYEEGYHDGLNAFQRQKAEEERELLEEEELWDDPF